MLIVMMASADGLLYCPQEGDCPKLVLSIALASGACWKPPQMSW